MEHEKSYIKHLLNQGARLDGRGPVDYRDVQVEYDVVDSAQGSAKVSLGNTVVIAGIKMSAVEPYADSPDDGTLMVNVELIPMASEDFEAGPPRFDAIELARVVDRGIREGKTIDTKKLKLANGKVWMVSIDLIPMNNAGNLFDAMGLAAIAALKNTKIPTINGDEIDYDNRSDEGLPLNSEPIPVTVLRIGDNYITDPNVNEYKALDARLTVGILADGKLCSMQKGGKGSITVEDVDKMIDIAVMKSEEIRKNL